MNAIMYQTSPATREPIANYPTLKEQKVTPSDNKVVDGPDHFRESQRIHYEGHNVSHVFFGDYTPDHFRHTTK